PISKKADVGKLAVTVLGGTNHQDSAAWQHQLNRASAYERLGQYENAVAAYEKAIELNPDSAVTYNGLAWAYVTWPTNFRSAAKALPLALKAVELSKTDHNEMNTLGVVYYRLGRL